VPRFAPPAVVLCALLVGATAVLGAGCRDKTEFSRVRRVRRSPSAAPAPMPPIGASQPPGGTYPTVPAYPMFPGAPGAPPTIVPTGAPPPARGNSAPPSADFEGCPAQGMGGDAQLNVLKNRSDEAPWTTVPFAWLAHLPWPPGVERQRMSEWSPQDAAQVAQDNGRPVAIEGYIAQARVEGEESVNCRFPTQRDFHVWLVEQPAWDRAGAIVVEPTPRVRALHPGWTIERFHALARRLLRVRISGWTLLDPEHPDQVGRTRGTIWEVHPVMQVEVQLNGAWLPLDQAPLG
jgi:hypothetical protein